MIIDTKTTNILKNAKTIAIIGAKDKDGHAVNTVGRYLIKAGYTVFPVHPKRNNVWGLHTYKSIAELPQDVDIINVFRASAYCFGHAEEVMNLSWKPLCFWLQEGIFSLEAIALLTKHGIHCTQNMCIKTVHENML